MLLRARPFHHLFTQESACRFCPHSKKPRSAAATARSFVVAAASTSFADPIRASRRVRAVPRIATSTPDFPLPARRRALSPPAGEGGFMRPGACHAARAFLAGRRPSWQTDFLFRGKPAAPRGRGSLSLKAGSESIVFAARPWLRAQRFCAASVSDLTAAALSSTFFATRGLELPHTV